MPTLGVSFGLPFPTHNYPLSPYAPHVPNAHFGAISPNGLNLGLLNVNPLFSLQVTKNELGEKLVKPFVNLHVTPNENIIGKIGSLFLAKKGALHKHYHHHLHRYPPPPPPPYHFGEHHSEFPHEIHPHIGEHPPFIPHSFEHGPPIIEGPPIGHHHSPEFLSPHPFLKDHRFGRDIIIDDISTNPGLLGFRSNNISIDSDFDYKSLFTQNHPNNLNFAKDELRYARGYSNQANPNEIKANLVHSIPPQGPGIAEGSEQVSFPTSRRRRDTDQQVPASLEKKVSGEGLEEETDNDSEGRAFNGKRQAFYQQQYPTQQKQCGPRAVCCRKPIRQFPQQQPVNQYNRCGVRNTQGITGRIKNPSYIDGDSEFGEWPW